MILFRHSNKFWKSISVRSVENNNTINMTFWPHCLGIQVEELNWTSQGKCDSSTLLQSFSRVNYFARWTCSKNSLQCELPYSTSLASESLSKMSQLLVSSLLAFVFIFSSVLTITNFDFPFQVLGRGNYSCLY